MVAATGQFGRCTYDRLELRSATSPSVTGVGGSPTESSFAIGAAHDAPRLPVAPAPITAETDTQGVPRSDDEPTSHDERSSADAARAAPR